MNLCLGCGLKTYSSQVKLGNLVLRISQMVPDLFVLRGQHEYNYVTLDICSSLHNSNDRVWVEDIIKSP